MNKFFKQFVPNVRWTFLYIDYNRIISYIIRVFSLAIRLSANMTASCFVAHNLWFKFRILNKILVFLPLSLIILMLILTLEIV